MYRRTVDTIHPHPHGRETELGLGRTSRCISCEPVWGVAPRFRAKAAFNTAVCGPDVDRTVGFWRADRQIKHTSLLVRSIPPLAGTVHFIHRHIHLLRRKRSCQTTLFEQGVDSCMYRPHHRTFFVNDDGNYRSKRQPGLAK